MVIYFLCRGYFDVYEDEIKDASPNGQVAVQLDSESVNFMHQRLHEVDLESRQTAGKNLESSTFVTKHLDDPGQHKIFGGSLLPEHELSHAGNTALPTER